MRLDHEHSESPDNRFLGDLAHLFQQRKLEPETTLEVHDSPWSQVYLIQYGVMRLYREAPSGRIAVHHFFSEVTWYGPFSAVPAPVAIPCA